jgi:prevent-host-death family protein
MNRVTIRELRNHGREVIERVAAGEQLVVTRNGRAVAELRPLRRTAIPADVLLERWRAAPAIDPAAHRRDIDSVIDPAL